MDDATDQAEQLLNRAERLLSDVQNATAGTPTPAPPAARTS